MAACVRCLGTEQDDESSASEATQPFVKLMQRREALGRLVACLHPGTPEQLGDGTQCLSIRHGGSWILDLGS